MPTANFQSAAARTTPYWRRSLAVLLLGVVALLANIDFTQQQEIHGNFSDQSGQAESFPRADLALLLHKDLPLQRLIAQAISSGDDSEKQSPAWLPLVAVDQSIFSSGSRPFITAHAVVYYASPRIHGYSSRAPPRS